MLRYNLCMQNLRGFATTDSNKSEKKDFAASDYVKGKYAHEENRDSKEYRMPRAGYRIPPKEDLTFSALARKKKDYSIDAIREPKPLDKPFVPKEEVKLSLLLEVLS